MYLLATTTLTLHSFIGDGIPPYAILSRVWGPEEVTYVSMAKPKRRSSAKQQAGFQKIDMCCQQALKDGYEWVWVDTCCIDKRSSAELSEAINSMFLWYRRAAFCYVYLYDVDVVNIPDVEAATATARNLADSRWFTRGWTLQELLAPHKLVFFAHNWSPIGYMTNYRNGDRKPSHQLSHPEINLADQLSQATLIPADFLIGKKSLRQASVAQRMCLASWRSACHPAGRESPRSWSVGDLESLAA